MGRQRSGVDKDLKKEQDEDEESQSLEDEPITKRRPRKRRRQDNEEEVEELNSNDLLNTSNGSNNNKKKRPSVFGPVDYVPGESVGELEPYIGGELHVNIQSYHLTFNNEQVKFFECWGSGPYSADSDIVCILQHSGIYQLTNAVPSFYALRVVLQILPGASNYQALEKNGVESKSCGARSVSLAPIEVEIVQEPDLKADKRRLQARSTSNGRKNGSGGGNNQQLVFTPPAPFLESTAVGGNGSSSSGSSSSSGNGGGASRGKARKSKKSLDEEVSDAIAVNVWSDTLLQFNSSNELCFKYCFPLIFDRGVKPTQWTSYRLNKAVLMLENRKCRYELSRQDPTGTNQYDQYRFAVVLSPYTKTREWYSQNRVPLLEMYIQVIERNLDWSQIIWTNDALRINSMIYPIETLCWISHNDPNQ